jgi:transcriptional regulator with XRE-family HTH domain
MTSGQEATAAQAEEELSLLITQLMNEITWYMHERDLTRADLASRMGVSPGRVSQVLSGGENLTLRTLASLATALDARFELELRPLKPVADAATSDYDPRPADQPSPRTVSFGKAGAFPRRR